MTETPLHQLECLSTSNLWEGASELWLDESALWPGSDAIESYPHHQESFFVQ